LSVDEVIATNLKQFLLWSSRGHLLFRLIELIIAGILMLGRVELAALFIQDDSVVPLGTISIPAATVIEAEGVARGNIESVVGRNLKIEVADLIFVTDSPAAESCGHQA
jgi:hypothetical protein